MEGALDRNEPVSTRGAFVDGAMVSKLVPNAGGILGAALALVLRY